MNSEKLLLELQNRGIDIDENRVNQLTDFMHFVLSWNEKINLTAIKDEESFMEKMIFDSAIALNEIDLSNKKVLDVGTGAGFPGVVLYIINPKIKLTLLDSTNKKINLLKQYALENNFSYEAICDRAENYVLNNKEKYDFVFARAVAPLNILLELCTPFLKVGGTFVALKGPGLDEELNTSQNALKKLNCHIKKVVVDYLPESNETRNIIHIEKDKATPQKYPRQYNQMKKNPL